MVEIRYEDDLNKWLEDKPKHWSVALAARSAFRAIAFIGVGLESLKKEENWPSTIVLPVLRATRISASASKFPDADMKKAASSADSAFSAAFSAADSAFSAADSADASASSASAESSARSAVWRAISRDCEILQQGEGLWKEPLWHGQNPNQSDQFWADLKGALLEDGAYWQTLIEWYEDRLMGDEAAIRAGRPSIRDMELEIANLSDEVWSDAKRANEAIKEIQDRYWGKQAHETDQDIEQDISEVEIPPQKPAAIEPIWVGNKVMLPKEAADADLDPKLIEASLAALKGRAEKLASEISHDTNIGSRFKEILVELLETIPNDVPALECVFDLGIQFGTLKELNGKVQSEWADELAAKYFSLTNTLEQVLRKFPEWREFNDNFKEVEISAEAVELHTQIHIEITKGLERSDVATVVSREVTNTADRLHGQRNTEDGSPLDPETERKRVYDGYESKSNILKTLISRFGDGFAEELKNEDLVKAAGKSAAKQVRTEAENFGPNLKKAIKAVAKPIVKAGQKAAGGWIVDTFKWLFEMLPNLKRLTGWDDDDIEDEEQIDENDADESTDA